MVFDFVRIGETARNGLGEDQFSIEMDVEDPTSSFDQLRTNPELSLDLVRQAGGSRLVVSNYAVFNRQ